MGSRVQDLHKKHDKTYPATNRKEEKLKIEMQLFPDYEEGMGENPAPAEHEAITVDEVKAAARNIRIGKAPGIDGIPAECVKAAVLLSPGEFTGALWRRRFFLRNGRWPGWCLCRKGETCG